MTRCAVGEREREPFCLLLICAVGLGRASEAVGRLVFVNGRCLINKLILSVYKVVARTEFIVN